MRTLAIEWLLSEYAGEDNDNAGQDQQARESSHWYSYLSPFYNNILGFILPPRAAFGNDAVPFRHRREPILLNSPGDQPLSANRRMKCRLAT